MLITIIVECDTCQLPFKIKVKADDYLDWVRGKLIQLAMPYLSPGDRELLLSKMCNSCFDKLFLKKEIPSND